MRRKTFKIAPLAGVVLLSGFIILFPFFGIKAQNVKKEDVKEQRSGDTPRHKTIIIKEGDLDKALAEIDRVNLDSIQITVKNALATVDFDAIGKSIEASIKAVNTDSIRLQVEAAIKSIDIQKIQADINRSMADAQKAMTELQKSDWQKEFQKGMKEMQESMTEMKLQMPEIKKEMEAAKKEVATAKLDMKDDMAKAKMDIEKARVEIKELKSAVAEMKKDGLIKEGESVKLEWKDGRLYINGKEQSEAVSDKYRKLENIHFQRDNDNDLDN